MIHIAICDDDTAITGYAEELVLKLGQSMRQKLTVSLFLSGEEFCHFLGKSDEVFNIVLMDIEMGNITGIEAGRKLRENIENDQTFLIYISSYNNYYKDIIDLNVLYFIPKPFHIPEFNAKLKSAIEKVIYQRHRLPFPDFSYKKNGCDFYVPVKSIMYLESYKRTINLHTITGMHTYYGSLNAEDGRLPKESFCRIHRSFLICFDYITKITAQSVTISNVEFNIGAKYRESTKAAYLHYRGT